MKATVEKEFWGCVDGEAVPTFHRAGDSIAGDLARVAVAEGWAKEARGRGRPKKKVVEDAPTDTGDSAGDGPSDAGGDQDALPD